jgi:lysophospholipase L1-like esterase
MSNYDAAQAPRAGWGQMLQEFMKEEVNVYNEASSGRSSKSFIHEGRLAKIAKRLQAGDYLLIQFGHNDSKSDEERYTIPSSSYKSYLKLYIELAKRKKAFPVLITPVQRRSFNELGQFIDTHGSYPTAMRELAKACDVPIIDLGEKSKLLFEKLGPEKTKELFLWIEQGGHINYLDGIQDDTHFSEIGAKKIAKLVIEGIKEQNLSLCDYLK